uniref:Uncharacterized protein n=1 Tax=viral metagenome TaxID=1070528 RepID=A0A6M3JV67_9ZZZZ
MNKKEVMIKQILEYKPKLDRDILYKQTYSNIIFLWKMLTLRELSKIASKLHNGMK